MKKGESNYKVWLGKASNDMLNIDNNLASEDVPWDTVCFHSQQAAEKVLKALLVFNGEKIDRTHDLVALLTQLVEIYPELIQYREPCQRLNYYAVAVRYPDDLFEPDEKEGLEMVAISRDDAINVWGDATFLVRYLGLQRRNEGTENYRRWVRVG